MSSGATESTRIGIRDGITAARPRFAASDAGRTRARPRRRPGRVPAPAVGRELLRRSSAARLVGRCRRRPRTTSRGPTAIRWAGSSGSSIRSSISAPRRGHARPSRGTRWSGSGWKTRPISVSSMPVTATSRGHGQPQLAQRPDAPMASRSLAQTTASTGRPRVASSTAARGGEPRGDREVLGLTRSGVVPGDRRSSSSDGPVEPALAARRPAWCRSGPLTKPIRRRPISTQVARPPGRCRAAESVGRSRSGLLLGQRPITTTGRGRLRARLDERRRCAAG